MSSSTVIGQNIKRLRAARGLTQKQLSDLSGCSSVANLEAGIRHGAYVASLTAIAVALDVPVAELFRDE